MSRFDPAERRLGPLSRDVLVALVDATTDEDGITRAAAIDVIEQSNAEAADRFWAGTEPEHMTAEIEDILESLEQRGFLYTVGNRLYVTERNLPGEPQPQGRHK